MIIPQCFMTFEEHRSNMCSSGQKSCINDAVSFSVQYTGVFVTFVAFVDGNRQEVSSFDKVPLSFTGFSLYFRTSPKLLARSTRACRVDLSALVWSPCVQPGSHSRQLAFLGSRSKLRSCSCKALALASPLAMYSSLRLTSFLHLGFDSKCHLFQEVLPDFPCTKVPPSSLCHSIWFCYFTDLL